MVLRGSPTGSITMVSSLREIPTLAVGERSNFKKFPTHTQDHGDASQREGRV